MAGRDRQIIVGAEWAPTPTLQRGVSCKKEGEIGQNKKQTSPGFSAGGGGEGRRGVEDEADAVRSLSKKTCPGKKEGGMSYTFRQEKPHCQSKEESGTPSKKPKRKQHRKKRKRIITQNKGICERVTTRVRLVDSEKNTERVQYRNEKGKEKAKGYVKEEKLKWTHGCYCGVLGEQRR